THKGTETDIKESTLKHQQKRDRKKLPVDDSIHDEVAEIDGKRQLGEWERRLERPVLAAPPWLRLALNSVLWCPREIRFVVNHRFKHCSRIVEREPNSQRKQTWQKKKFFEPRCRMQLALRANVKKADRSRCCQENRDIDEQRANPANRRPTAGRI